MGVIINATDNKKAVLLAEDLNVTVAMNTTIEIPAIKIADVVGKYKELQFFINTSDSLPDYDWYAIALPIPPTFDASANRCLQTYMDVGCTYTGGKWYDRNFALYVDGNKLYMAYYVVGFTDNRVIKKYRIYGIK